ncbi:MAG: DsrE family protein [Pseudomonadota bacterium]|nr:DsrE family protein [Pseudomonadota bacterium]
MSHVKATLIAFLFFSIAAILASIPSAMAEDSDANISLSPLPKEQNDSETLYVFDVVVHKPDEMDKLLGRIEQLSSTITPNKNDPRLALVLHGPEIAFFTRKNYPQYMDIVDRAAELDKKGIIDVKVCDTMIRALDIDASELPDFVEHVPYGPSEVDRLIKQGFIKM